MTRPAENDLREREEKYRVIFEHANDLIVFTDVDGRFVEVNPKLEEIFGYRRPEFIGRHFSEIGVLSPEDLQKARHAHRRTLAGISPEIQEFEVFRRDGTRASVEVNARVLSEGKRIKGSILIIRDITERKQAEEALRKAHEALERKVRERTANLEEVNTALRVLLKKREEDRTELEERILYNIRELVMPYLEKLKGSGLDEMQATQVGILESNLNDILSPLVRGMSMGYLKFTPTEIQVANHVKQGRPTKEISDLMSLSSKTIEFHRDNIRKKLGIKNRKANLRTYLLSLQ